jgi:transposase InsO family protein
MNRSTFRHQMTRHPSDQEVRRILLADTIKELHLASRSTYGVRRMRASLLHERGLVVNPKLIRRIMAAEGLSGLPARRKGRRNLVNAATSEDLVNRQFSAAMPNTLWLTDITEHKTREGTLYCCAVLDQHSRRIVGWAIDRRNEATLVNDALIMAAKSRSTSPSTILHSDHGSQFTSWTFTQSLKHHKILGSMGIIGDCFDNAPMESFWGSMQIELLNRQSGLAPVRRTGFFS